MGREQDSFEWVNAWADATGKLAEAALPDAARAEVTHEHDTGYRDPRGYSRSAARPLL